MQIDKLNSLGIILAPILYFVNHYNTQLLGSTLTFNSFFFIIIIIENHRNVSFNKN